MVNQTRNFIADLLHELKYFSHCKLKAKDPNHFCCQQELSKNLTMSLRDVGHYLHKMTEMGLTIHDYYKYKGRLRHRFIPVDKRRFESPEMINGMHAGIEAHLKRIRELAKKMRKRPSTHSIKMIPLIPNLPKGTIRKNEKGLVESRSYTGKIDKKGHQYLTDFCDSINDIFAYIDSMSYATLDDTITPNEQNKKRIKELRKNTLEEITYLINYTINPLPARQSHAIKQDILMRIPTYFMLLQLQKQSKIMI